MDDDGPVELENEPDWTVQKRRNSNVKSDRDRTFSSTRTEPSRKKPREEGVQGAEEITLNGDEMEKIDLTSSGLKSILKLARDSSKSSGNPLLD